MPFLDSVEKLEYKKLPKQSKLSPAAALAVRTRRAYFDCGFGQLHVRTAFPATGGFDEQTTLLCLHPSEGSSRSFDRFLPEIGTQRSVYAPDLPGFGESDPAPTRNFTDAARAVLDFATDLRLRRVDLLGFGFGAGVAMELAAANAELARRLVLMRVPPMHRVATVRQETLVLKIKGDETSWSKGVLANARLVELADYGVDVFDAAPQSIAREIAAFLDA